MSSKAAQMKRRLVRKARWEHVAEAQKIVDLMAGEGHFNEVVQKWIDHPGSFSYKWTKRRLRDAVEDLLARAYDDLRVQVELYTCRPVSQAFKLRMEPR